MPESAVSKCHAQATAGWRLPELMCCHRSAVAAWAAQNEPWLRDHAVQRCAKHLKDSQKRSGSLDTPRPPRPLAQKWPDQIPSSVLFMMQLYGQVRNPWSLSKVLSEKWSLQSFKQVEAYCKLPRISTWIPAFLGFLKNPPAMHCMT